MKRRAFIATVGVTLVAVPLAALGQASGAASLRLQADPHGKIRYNKKTLTARSGVVTIVMSNPKGSGLQHGIAVQGKGVDKDGKIVASGKTSTLSLRLKPGRYTFYCNFDGHKGLGMKGTLIVK
jgi:plastocyanin